MVPKVRLKIHWFLNEKQVHKTILKVFLEISFPFPYFFLPFRARPLAPFPFSAIVMIFGTRHLGNFGPMKQI